MRFRHHASIIGLLLCFFATPTSASPLTYAFTAEMNLPVPWLGNTTHVTGELTLDDDPATMRETIEGFTQTGSPVSLKLDIGGHQVTLRNTNDGASSVFFSSGPSTSPGMPGRVSIAANSLDSSLGKDLFFYWTTYIDPPSGGYSDFRNLELGSFLQSSSNLLSIGRDSESSIGYRSNGEFTSIHLVTTPEPSTLAGFLVLGMGAVWLRRSTNTTSTRNSL